MNLCAKLTRNQAVKLYTEIMTKKDSVAMRRLALEDLFFLLYVVCMRRDMNRDWLYDRVREVEADPDGNLDLWAREHYKSTIITFGLTIQDILKNPDNTVGIFSHTRPTAKAFLSQIKREFEVNTLMQDLFPEILYKNPQKEAPKWSLDDGIVVKRKSNPKESTIEAWGLVDGQPTSKHFSRLVYDDVVTKESVSTPDMIKKVTESWELSLNLSGADCRIRNIGTRYHANDTYKTMIDRGSARVRIHAATDDGTFRGKPVFMTQQRFDEKVRDMGTYTASAQLLLNPLADSVMGFKEEWLEYYTQLHPGRPMNYYLLVDPSGSKKKVQGDYTCMVVIGMSSDKNYYLVDGVRDRMNLTERTNKLIELHRRWKPRGVGYEEYGMQADIEHIEYVQEQTSYRFHITPLGGTMPKNDRIRRLVPIFEQHRFYLPPRLLFVTAAGRPADFILELKRDEYLTFPVSAHDDMMDCISRVVEPDLVAVFPKEEVPQGRPEFANVAENAQGAEFATGSKYHPFGK